MAQASALCPGSIKICALRVTRLANNGSLAPGPRNSYVTSGINRLTYTPDIDAGQQKVVRGGCDCIAMAYRGVDQLLRFNLELEGNKIEPGLEELFLGASAIMDASDIPVPIGVQYPGLLACGVEQPMVGVEAWAQTWDVDHQDPDFPFIRYVFPASKWQMGQRVLQNDIATPVFTGFTVANPLWSDHYGDWPADVVTDGGPGQHGGWFFDTAIPAAACGYKTASSS